uniref:RING-type E3 ubiquitin transferase n=1 Tax=Anolis carolinensis TaxID=28377 RepID=A0A803TKQ3_ANOCA
MDVQRVDGYSRCPICLEKIQNVAFLNPCFHRFCFACILEWSDRKAECPLLELLCRNWIYNRVSLIQASLIQASGLSKPFL